jgi:CelD/BcsL family acetyltransferase involved in cellulose biosynthesis
MEVQVVSALSTFQAMKGEWNELAERFHSPLLSHEWFAANVDAFCSKRRSLAVLVLRSDRKLRAVAPLMARYHLGVPQFQFLGAYGHGEPGGFLYDGEESLTILLQTLIEFRRSVFLFRSDSSSQEASMLKELQPKSSLCIQLQRESDCSLWVPLKDRWEDFEATISSKRRSDLRRYFRRAERIGKLDFEVVSPTVETLGPYLEELFRIEAAGWKGQSGTAILSNPARVRFFSQYARAAAELKQLRMFFLRVGGKTIAARMAIEHRNRLWDLKIGYDETMSECAPGVLLTHETIRYAVSRGLEAYEFLGRAESWERLWPCQERRYVTTKMYPASVSGGLFVMLDGCRWATRQASKIMLKQSAHPPTSDSAKAA